MNEISVQVQGPEKITMQMVLEYDEREKMFTQLSNLLKLLLNNQKHMAQKQARYSRELEVVKFIYDLAFKQKVNLDEMETFYKHHGYDYYLENIRIAAGKMKNVFLPGGGLLDDSELQPGYTAQAFNWKFLPIGTPVVVSNDGINWGLGCFRGVINDCYGVQILTHNEGDDEVESWKYGHPEGSKSFYNILNKYLRGK